MGKKPLAGLVRVARRSKRSYGSSEKQITKQAGLGQSKSTKGQKSVRFATHNELAFRHVTQEELDQAWYQQHELQSFKDDCLRTTRVFQRARGDVSRFDSSKVCLRGLESQLTRTSNLTRRMTISMTIASVLDAQKFTGTPNPERLWQASRTFSESSARRAINMAAQDALQCEF